MKKILYIAVSILLFSCSKPDTQTNTDNTIPVQWTDKVYTGMIYLDGTFERFNADGNSLPVSNTDAVTIFDKTTNIKITQSTFETNLTPPVSYFITGNTYSIVPQTQFVIYENSRIIIKKIEYPTSYGKDKRSERYSY